MNKRFHVCVRLALAVLTVLLLGAPVATPSAAADDELSWSLEPTNANQPTAAALAAVETADAPPWGACGLSTDPQKAVRAFSSTYMREWILRCGGPKYSSEPTWGYRHILWRHRGDFERIALGTNQNWRDVADLALNAIVKDPDKLGYQNGKNCASRVIFLINKRTGQVVRQQIVKMISVHRAGNSNDIISAYPSGVQC